ncbi:MAG: hypothetical protein K8F91_15520 [Candidatus Obscuribacterales bacterium]|nr:hypothetical protein [Candidatus Obscuribacterales bacterium]
MNRMVGFSIAISILLVYPGSAFAQADIAEKTSFDLAGQDEKPSLKEAIPADHPAESRETPFAKADSDEPVVRKSASDVALPQRMASFAVGAVVGMPIAIARRTYHQTRQGSRDLIGESRNPLLVVPTTILSLPFAIMGGPVEGFGYAIYNSWKGSGVTPFGCESFSLGEME